MQRNLPRRRLRHLLDGLGPLSPFATLATYTPASRLLLAEAERSAEIALHGVRAVFWILLAAVFSFELGFLTPGLAPFVVLAVAYGAGVWWLIWRLLRRPIPPPCRRYGLIVLDGWGAVRSALVFHAPFRDRFVSLFGISLNSSATTLERAAVSPADFDGAEVIDLRGRGAPVAVHYLLTPAQRPDARRSLSRREDLGAVAG
jgi:hypothetical protein